MRQGTLFEMRGPCSPAWVSPTLSEHHYLGPTDRGLAWEDERGCLVLASPTSRNLPGHWLELTRWCLTRGKKNDGSSQWAEVRAWLIKERPEVTTVVSYSDPSAGHDGALYRACGWVWAPTWHRLRPPPTANGSWTGEKTEAVKDRWVAPLRRDDDRATVLSLKDSALERRMPWAEYQEPRFRRGVAVPYTGGGDFKRWVNDG